MKLLLVEDERKIAKALKEGFEDERYLTDISYDGEEGLVAATGGDYDLIILDVMLPSMDGLEVCRRLRAGGNKVPIIMLTAKGQVRDRVAGLNIGADDYMVKPFSFEELLARVRALLRRPADILGNVLRVEDLALDPVSYEVRRSDKAIDLSSTEFCLLEYMMRNPGRILSKTNLINHVWDFDADILPNTVETYISYLRNKVDKPFQTLPPLIHTVRGFGYRIGARR